MTEQSLYAVHRVRPANLDWKLFSPIKLRFRAYVPGLEADGDVFARTNISVNCDDSVLSELEKICPKPGTANLEEYQEIARQVRDVLPADLHSAVEPGLRFGPPEVTSAGRVLIDVFDFGVVSAKVQACWQEAGVSGARYFEVVLGRKARNCPDLFAIEAPFAALDQRVQQALTSQPFSRRKLPDVSTLKFLVGTEDVYRLPPMFGGFLFSQAAVDSLRSAAVNLQGVEFQKVDSGLA